MEKRGRYAKLKGCYLFVAKGEGNQPMC